MVYFKEAGYLFSTSPDAVLLAAAVATLPGGGPRPALGVLVLTLGRGPAQQQQQHGRHRVHTTLVW